MIQDPPDPTQAASNRRLCNGWPILWLIAGSVWLIAIVFLLVIPTDPKNSQILGFSTNRLALLGAAFLFFSTHLGMAWISYSRPDFRSRTLDPLILDIHKFRLTISLLIHFLSRDMGNPINYGWLSSSWASFPTLFGLH